MERNKVDEELVLHIEQNYLKDMMNFATLLKDKKLAKETWLQMKKLRMKRDWKQWLYYLSSKLFITRSFLSLLKKYKYD